MAVDISDLPVPSSKALDISDLPAPAPKAESKGVIDRVAKALHPGFTSKTEQFSEEPSEDAMGVAGFRTSSYPAAAAYGKRLLGQVLPTAAAAMVPGSWPLWAGIPAVLGTYFGAGKLQEKAGAALPQPVQSTLGITPDQLERERAKMPFAVNLGEYTPAVVGGVKLTKLGYDKLANVLKTKFGGDAKALADALRAASGARSAEAAAAAQRTADEAARVLRQSEQAATRATARQSQAERIAADQAAKAGREYRATPGVKTVEEAGAFRPVPETTESIGSRIKSYAEKMFKDLKAARAKKADINKARTFIEALVKEKSGARVSNTQAFKEMEASIENAITNPETGLSNVPVAEIRNQLMNVRNAINENTSFEGLEVLRRSLRDRAYGVPAEGFDAIGQQQAGKLAESVEKIMQEFSPQIRTFLDDYRAASEPLRVFQSRIGKALVGDEAKAAGYASVPSANIPDRVFANKDSFEALVDALGGNRQLAEAEARKYFASQIESLAGDPAKIEKFIRNNRAILQATNSTSMVEDLLARTTKQVGRGEAAAARAETEQKAVTAAGKEVTAAKSAEEAAQKQKVAYDQLNVQMNQARTVDEIVQAHNATANKLFKDGAITKDQYETLIAEGKKIIRVAKKAEDARGLVKKILGGLGIAAGTIAGYEKYKGATSDFE